MTREPIARTERFAARAGLSAAGIDDAIGTALDRVRRNIARFGGLFPAPSSVNGRYPLLENTEWTSGFWSGVLWTAYYLSGDMAFRSAAERQIAGYADRVTRRRGTDTHDLGFLYSLSCVAAHKLTGDGVARDSAVQAAELLLDRFLPTAGIIQAWGDLKAPDHAGRMIIDCNLNLPLLYWASAQTGDSKYRLAADSHIRQAAKHLVRPDASSFHTFFMDPVSGVPRFGKTHQGFSDTSCWSRGQAWGIAGFPLVHRHLRDPLLIDTAAKQANYFLNRLPGDLVCCWDLAFVDRATQRDSSASAIAVCGLLELAKHLPDDDDDRDDYIAAAKAIASSLIASYACKADDPCDGLLRHGVYHMPKHIGVDECCIWGDYFYLEALARLRSDWETFW